MQMITEPSEEQIVEIVTLLHEESDRVLQLDKQSIADIFQNRQGIAAIDDERGHAIGFIKFIDCGMSEKENRHVFEVGSWIVARSERGKGIGKQLLVAIVKHIKSLYSNPLIVDVTQKKNTETCHLLEAMRAKEITKPDCLVLYPEGADEKSFRFFDLTSFD